MATVVIAFNSACAGGGHLNLNITIDGVVQQLQLMTDDIFTASPPEVIHDFVLGVLRLHLKGMTRSQARAALQAGFTVIV